MSLPFRNYTFLGATQSLCPACLRLVPAKILDRGGRVYFRKTCPEHGVREDFVCGDAAWFDRGGYHTPAKEPLRMSVEPAQGCPYDCGLCTEHEQHTCLGLLEITSSCNLECPVCFASSGPGGKHLSVEQCRRAIDALVAAEGQPEVLQLSGGEPTIHPEFLTIFDYAIAQPIDFVLINTNGIRLANDARMVDHLAAHADRCEVYLQFDSLEEEHYGPLRGENLLEIKMRAIERCHAAGLRTTLVATLQAGVNEDQVAPITRFAASQRMTSGVSFQPATYVGRHFLPEDLEDRVTFPDVIFALTSGDGASDAKSGWVESDFAPLPCAHPNAHTMAYAYRNGADFIPLARIVDMDEHLDLLAGGITFTRPRAREVIRKFMERQCCGPGGCGTSSHGDGRTHGELPVLESGACDGSATADGAPEGVLQSFLDRAMDQQLGAGDMFRVTTTSFMDVYNFDVRQAMKSCVHFVLPSGHIVPFSPYNILYREGHVPLPPIKPRMAFARGGTSVAIE